MAGCAFRRARARSRQDARPGRILARFAGRRATWPFPDIPCNPLAGPSLCGPTAQDVGTTARQLHAIVRIELRLSRSAALTSVWCPTLSGLFFEGWSLDYRFSTWKTMEAASLRTGSRRGSWRSPFPPPAAGGLPLGVPPVKKERVFRPARKSAYRLTRRGQKSSLFSFPPVVCRP